MTVKSNTEISRRPKLVGDKQYIRIEICKLLAMGFNTCQVCDEVRERFGIELAQQTIYETYYKRRAKTIAFLRERWEKGLMKHPLASKINRLNHILWLLQKAETWSTDKLYFDKDGNLVGRVEKLNLSAAAQLIREAREEIEGKAKDKEGKEGSKKYDLIQLIKVLSNDKSSVTSIETRVGEGQVDSSVVDQPRSRYYEVL
jgi:hypothetical protein